MAGSMMSGRLVAPIMNTFFFLLMPSISVRTWLMTRSAAPPVGGREREGGREGGRKRGREGGREEGGKEGERKGGGGGERGGGKVGKRVTSLLRNCFSSFQNISQTSKGFPNSISVY